MCNEARRSGHTQQRWATKGWGTRPTREDEFSVGTWRGSHPKTRGGNVKGFLRTGLTREHEESLVTARPGAALSPGQPRAAPQPAG